MKTPIVDEQSVSEVLRSSTILLLRLNKVTFAQWVESRSEAESFHTNIKRVYLTNILGLNDRVPHYSADAVFKDQTNEHQLILSTLKQRTQEKYMSGLVQWLQTEEVLPGNGGTDKENYE
ncbi:hypothetical protein ACFL6S_02145 [Candidatus Poribacteria bacterium]